MKENKRLASMKAKYEGKVFSTNNYGDVEVLEYINSRCISIRFFDSGNNRITGISELMKGEIRDNEAYPVYTTGVQDIRGYLVRGQPHPKDYSVWNGIRQRCYNENIRKKNPAYQECTMSENFLLFSYFKDWYHKQIGHDQEGWDLDKDILVKGNKIYSEDTCCFVPKEINCALATSINRRGDKPQGVIWNCTKTRYRARIQRGDKWESLGTYSTTKEAFYVYKPIKEAHIKALANKWKDQIDPRVYNALMCWEINIDD